MIHLRSSKIQHKSWRKLLDCRNSYLEIWISAVRVLCWKDTLIISRAMLRQCTTRSWLEVVDLDQHRVQGVVARTPWSINIPMRSRRNIFMSNFLETVSMMTPSPAGKFQIENDEEVTHRNMQEHEYRSAGFEEPTDGDGPAHGISSANLESRSDIEEPADGDILTSVDDGIYTKESVETEGMENLGFAHLKIGVDKPKFRDLLKITRETLSPPLSAECKKVTEKPLFESRIISVHLPGQSLWSFREISIDAQGYLTISPATASIVNTIPFSSDDSPATERWKVFSMPGRTERFHINDFTTIHSSQDFTVEEKIVLDHKDCGVLHIMCPTSLDHISLLRGCRIAH